MDRDQISSDPGLRSSGAVGFTCDVSLSWLQSDGLQFPCSDVFRESTPSVSFLFEWKSELSVGEFFLQAVSQPRGVAGCTPAFRPVLVTNCQRDHSVATINRFRGVLKKFWQSASANVVNVSTPAFGDKQPQLILMQDLNVHYSLDKPTEVSSQSFLYTVNHLL